MQLRKISFIGAGNMPRSIISGLITNGYQADLVMASNPSTPKLDALEKDFSIQVTQSNHQAAEFAQVIVLSVKPQLMERVCADLISSVDISDKIIVSIAAGITSDRLSAMLGGHKNIVRTMPNTPSSLGLGMTGLFANESVNEEDKAFVAHVMQQVGEVLWVEEEEQINTVIAAAGSSPAYFFLFAQAMQDEAMKMGLNKSDARLLVQQAMKGSAEMISHNSSLELSELRAQVTSKGGTTHEAIETFRKSGLEETVAKSMRAAVARAKEMSKQF